MFYIGLDLGKTQDPSAIAVVEAMEVRRPYGNPVVEGYVVRYLERLPLGTTYPRVVEQVQRIVMRPEVRGQCAVAADGTGVGEPVLDMLRAARLGCEVMSVKITSGERESRTGSTGAAPQVNVPKQDLIAGLQLVLESRELKICRGLRYAGALAKEMVEVRVAQRGLGRVRIGADGYGEHDDLVIALALGVWRARRGRQYVGFGGGRLPGVHG